MPLINNVFSFTAEELTLIESIKILDDFDHKKWSSNALTPIRIRIRNFYREHQNFICTYCKGDISTTSAFNAQVEHIVPKALHIDFMFTPKNLCVICADCNSIKSDKEVANEEEHTTNNENIIRYPTTADAFKIVHPHFDEYDEHIKIVADNFYVENNNSNKGRFTIYLCKLNRNFTRKYNRTEESLIDDSLNTTFQVFNEVAPDEKKIIVNSLLQSLLN
ncbi:MAG: HNH endonuclease [Gammaproteobacteria bacterium]|nr:HNH endonuclease [Gammaproteobacteria bacterium]MBU1465996.1 HNH endonuclease [Gammaproteobacteria bacterium]MBU2238676.1 HNH endonuclease [Gammaproteobacteria bacterium]MBU2317643.1 HNH endonuclease [Gammaproteobacteria bacterium]MBU2414203.1 HNH endonuclease [Gammaproteobacteria bacterium]